MKHIIHFFSVNTNKISLNDNELHAKWYQIMSIGFILGELKDLEILGFYGTFLC